VKPTNLQPESCTTGQYSIFENILKKRNHKIKIKIDADGYKTFFDTIYLTKLGWLTDGEIWSYNPNFKPEFIPKNEINSTLINSKLNFHLVKT
jgi:HKD family nuclease